MAGFAYKALDGAGRSQAGRITAATRQAAIAALADQSLFVTTIEQRAEAAERGTRQPVSLRRSGRRISPREMTVLWRQLATALEAGLTLLTALRVVEEQTEQRGIAELVSDLARRVEAGASLSEAMAEHPRVFSPLATSMVRAGETAGALDQVMGSLADFAERDLDTREQVRSAATYPAIVLLLAVVSVVVILTVILPRIMATVGDAAGTLPWPTRVLMAVGEAGRTYGWLAGLLAVGGAVVLGWWIRQPSGRWQFDRFRLAVPLIGKVIRQAAVARFARALGTLTGSGIQVVEALGVLRNTLGNEVLGQTIDQVRAEVTHGESVGQALRDSRQFPAMFVQVVALGEQTGRLDQLLLRAADAFERETKARIQRVMTVLPVLLIVSLALLVTFILAAVLLPIIDMQTAVPT